MLTMISFEKSHTYSKLKEFSLLNPLFSCLIPSGSDVFVTLVGTANVSREGGGEGNETTERMMYGKFEVLEVLYPQTERQASGQGGRVLCNIKYL